MKKPRVSASPSFPPLHRSERTRSYREFAAVRVWREFAAGLSEVSKGGGACFSLAAGRVCRASGPSAINRSASSWMISPPATLGRQKAKGKASEGKRRQGKARHIAGLSALCCFLSYKDGLACLQSGCRRGSGPWRDGWRHRHCSNRRSDGARIEHGTLAAEPQDRTRDVRSGSGGVSSSG